MRMGSGPVDCTYTDSDVDTADLTTYTFAAMSLGAAATNRYIVVSVGGAYSAAARSLSTVTVGGVAATVVVTVGSQLYPAGIAIAAVPTGATGDIVVTFSNGVSRCGIGGYRLTGLQSATPTATATDVVSAANALSASLAIPADGCGIGYVIADGSDPRTWSWTNLTENFDAGLESDTTHSGAMSTTAGTADRTATASGSLNEDREAMVLAAWR